VTVCSADDSLANILKYIGERRVHRFVIVADETVIETEVAAAGEEERDNDATPLAEISPPRFDTEQPAEKPRITKRKKVKDRLVGMISLSDIMKHIVGTKQKSLQGKSIIGLGVNEGKSTTGSVEILSGEPGLLEEVEEEDQSVVIDNEDTLDDEDGPT
jgi:CBS domain-containing protein